MKQKLSIPQIDLSPLWADQKNGVKIVANNLSQTYKELGFCCLVNHNIPKALFKSIFQAAKEFHALPLEAKMKIKQNNCFRGYMPINASQLKVSTEGAAKKPNQLESFIMAFDLPPDHPDYKTGAYLAGPNQWPEELVSFQKTMCDYRDAMLNLAKNLLKVFSVAFGMEPNYLDRFFINPSYFLRLQYYPKQPNQIPEEQYGIAPHTDYGFFTLLAQNDVEGLEIKTPSGEWVAVPCLPDTLVMNNGDMLKRWSNDAFNSIPHRVINRSEVERYSVPFFFEPNMHSMIGIIESCITPERPAKYSPIMYGEYLLDRIQGNYGLGNRG